MHDDSLFSLPIGGAELSLIDADEELIRAAGVVTLEADRSHREVERWRLETSAKLQRLTEMRREKNLLLGVVSRLEKSLEQAKTAASAPVERRLSSNGGRDVDEDGYKLKGGESVVVPGTFGLALPGSVTTKQVELRYLISRTISALDTLQTELAAWRQQHTDLWHRNREIADDIRRLKTTHEQQEKQRKELLQQKLFITAAEADPAFRKALQTKQEMEEFVRHANDRRLSLGQLRMQRASMVAHLLNGAVSRERQAGSLHEKIAQRKGFSDHPMFPMLLSFQEENTSLRTKYLQLIRTSEEEDVALAEYLNVLEERLLLDLRNKPPS